MSDIYSEWEHVQLYIKSIEKWVKGWTNHVNDFSLPPKSMESWTGKKNLDFYRGYKCTYSCSKSIKEVFSTQGEWQSPNMLPIIVNGQASLIITWQSPHREGSPYQPPRVALISRGFDPREHSHGRKCVFYFYHKYCKCSTIKTDQDPLKIVNLFAKNVYLTN